MVTSSAPSSLACTDASTAVMPPPITTTRRPTGTVDFVGRLADVGNEVHRIAQAFGLRLGRAQRI